MSKEIDINGTSHTEQTPTHVLINWMYPEIYDMANQSSLTIETYHTRVTNAIKIRYDSDRNGYIIERRYQSVWVEAAFIEYVDEDGSPEPEQEG